MRVLIVDDHRAVADALEIGLASDGHEVRSADDPEKAVGACADFRPDVVLLDLDLGEGVSGIDLVPDLAAHGRHIVALTGLTDDRVLADAYRAGVDAVIDKSVAFPDLVEQVAAVARGDHTDDRRHAVMHRARLAEEERRRALRPFEDLTAREQEVLAMLVEGRRAAEIAETTFVSMATVRSHIKSILSKLGTTSQLAAVSMAVRAGWAPRRRHPSGGDST